MLIHDIRFIFGLERGPRAVSFIGMNPHALSVLEYREALDLVARFASSELGAGAVRALQPSADLGWIAPELERVDQMRAFIGGDTGWSMAPVPDVREAVRRLRVEGSVLEAGELRGLAVLLASSRTTRRAVLASGGGERFPLLAMIAGGLLEAEKDEAQIGRAIDEAGAVRDDASPALYRLRREIKTVRGRLVERLAAFMATLPDHYRVSDASVTVRDGRYVIPVRREGRGEVGGIVHDESATGATLFVEPPLAVEAMNRLRELEAEEAREVLRILRELTDRLRPLHPEIVASLDGLVALDSLYARARYALRVHGHRPAMLPAGTEHYEVTDGRHPILLARSAEVVPFDLRMDQGERTLLISGPNTGGKTVLLKAVGLISLLAQSGVVPPVGPGTRLPVFREVFADIGDEQSIEASLSTFSAHLKNLREALDGAGWESLVLTDEAGSGTDPVEGGALAAAVLVELTRRSCFTVATTHLGQLKLLATQERGVVNASLQFDAERLVPTYRLVKGVPGRSYGLAIARRLGVAPAILADAEARVPDAERSLDALLAAVEERQRELAGAQVELAGRAVELDALQARLAAQQESQAARDAELKRREKDAERAGRQQARSYLLQARQRVEEALGAARTAADDAAAREARRLVEEGIREQGEELERTEKTEKTERMGHEDAVAVGDRVRLASGGAGQVLEIRPDGKLVVAMGVMKMVVDADQATRTASTKSTSASTTSTSSPSAPSSASSLELDLRGYTGDEAEMATIAAVDAAVLAEQPYLRIIHGMGTGVVRERVRRVVATDRRVARFGFAPRNQGGTGVTIVEFSA